MVLRPGTGAEKNGLAAGDVAVVTRVEGNGDIELRQRDGKDLISYFKAVDLGEATEGMSLLHYGALRGLGEGPMAVLLEADAEVAAAQDAGGKLALAVAATRCDLAVLHSLAVAAPLAVGTDGRCALHIFLDSCHTSGAAIERVLMADAAALAVSDGRSRLPWHVAEEHGLLSALPMLMPDAQLREHTLGLLRSGDMHGVVTIGAPQLHATSIIRAYADWRQECGSKLHEACSGRSAAEGATA